MKKLLKFNILPICFLLGLFQMNAATAQIKGNGKVITQEIEVKPFENLHINFPVNLTLDANSDYALTIITDENILPEIVLKNEKNKLEILQDKWIAPTSMVNVIIGTKGLTTFTTSGYGNANIYNLNESQLNINNEVGKVTLTGKVNTLNFSMETGNLDAKNLMAQNIKGSISSSGEAYVNAKTLIDVEVYDNGKLVYLEKPQSLKVNVQEDGEVLSLQEETAKSTKKESVKYVNVKLKNNRFTRIHTYIKGPKNKKFSYGMPFNPNQKRTESYPVGTKIYKVSKFGSKKLLLTINAEDEGQVVDLFESN